MELIYLRPPRTAREWLAAGIDALARWLAPEVVPAEDQVAAEIRDAVAALRRAEAEQERYRFTSMMLRKRLKSLRAEHAASLPARNVSTLKARAER